MSDIITLFTTAVQLKSDARAREQDLLLWRLDKLNEAHWAIALLPIITDLHSLSNYLSYSDKLIDAVCLAQSALKVCRLDDELLLSQMRILVDCVNRFKSANEKSDLLLCYHLTRENYHIAYTAYNQLLEYIRSSVTKQRDEVRMKLGLLYSC